MNLENIQKLIRKHIPEERIWRSNINGDDDYFYVKIVEKSNIVKKGYVQCTTSIGHRRYGEWRKFNIKFYNRATKIEVLNRIQNLVEYYNSCNKTSKSHAEGFRQYVEATGGHSGNPVWMD